MVETKSTSMLTILVNLPKVVKFFLQILGKVGLKNNLGSSLTSYIVYCQILPQRQTIVQVDALNGILEHIFQIDLVHCIVEDEGHILLHFQNIGHR